MAGKYPRLCAVFPVDVYVRDAYAVASSTHKDRSCLVVLCFSVVYHNMQEYIFCDVNGFRKKR